jgi:hypothetical protein
MSYVIDASIAASWFLPDEQSEAAEGLIAPLGISRALFQHFSGSKPAICSSWRNVAAV